MKKRTREEIKQAFVKRISEKEFDRAFGVMRLKKNYWRFVGTKETTVGDIRGWCARILAQLSTEKNETLWVMLAPTEGDKLASHPAALVNVSIVRGEWKQTK